MTHVNIIKWFKTDRGWKMASLDAKGRIKWSWGPVTYLLEWREQGRRCREAAGSTHSKALEAQRRKQFRLDAKRNNIELPSVSDPVGNHQPRLEQVRVRFFLLRPTR